MPRSQRTELLVELQRLLRLTDRYVDCAVRLRIYERGADGRPTPGELLPRVYGARYDRVERRYVGPATVVHEIPCHRGQLEILLCETPGLARVLAIGPPRGGKTRAAIIKFLLMALDNPNETAGLVGPTGSRTKQTVWDDSVRLWGALGLLDGEPSKSNHEIYLVNGVTAQVLAARRSSVAVGNPLQGRDWAWAVVDESQNIDEDSQREIDARGGRWGTRYCVFETATNAQIGEFRERLEIYKSRPETHRIIRFRPEDSPWIEADFYERLKATMDERSWRHFINIENVPSEQLVYPSFEFKRHVIPIPVGFVDITEQITGERYNHRVPWVVGMDFGVLVNASIFLKCFAHMSRPGERFWWAMDEITTWNKTADFHAREILRRYRAENLLVIADPHINVGRADADRSDYNLFEREGLTIKPAAAGFGTITQKHRIGMMNALLLDGKQQAHFFILADKNNRAACHRLVRAYLTQEWGDNGQEVARKNATDVSHWPCAVEYGLYPWERVRAQGTVGLLRAMQ